MAASAGFLAVTAWRYALRHKGQTARAIVGLLVATTVLVVGLGIADTITGSVERGAIAQFGGIDVVVTSAVPFNVTLRDELAALPLASAHHARGVVTLGVPGSVTVANGTLAQSNVVVRGVAPDEAALLGPLRTEAGAPVSEPRAGEVVLSQGLADTLGARVGDDVLLRVPVLRTVSLGQLRIAQLPARVVGIAVQEGRSGYVGTSTALVPLDAMQNATGEPGRANSALYVVDGGAIDAASEMQGHLRVGNDRTFSARADKATILAATRSSQNIVLGFILGMTSFTLIAAVLLAFALLSALVEERRVELGTMRALGLTRGEVALAMTIEGAYYTLAAALAGLALGIGALFGAVALLEGRVPAQFRRYIATTIQPGTLALALAIGVAVPLVTIAVGSLRFARLDPSRAIRGIAEDPKGERRVGLAGAFVLALGGLALLLVPFGSLAAWPLVLAAAAVALVAFGRPRLALVPLVAGAALLVYTLFAFAFPTERGAYDPIFTLGRGLLLALGLVALAVASPKPYDALARGARGRSSLLVAVRYLIARRRAAGLTMAMIAIVVMVVTTMGTLFSLFAFHQPDDIAGYQIEGTSPLPYDALSPPLPANLSRDVADLELLPRLARAGLTMTSASGTPLGGFGGVWGVTPGFARNATLEFSALAPRYATSRAAWLALAGGEAIAAPDEGRPHPERFWNATPGETVVVRAPDGVHAYVFAGFVRTSDLGVLVAARDADAYGLRASRVALVQAAPGVDPDVLAARLTAVYQEQGLSFESVRAQNAARIQAVQPLLLVLEAFLGVGLLVGLSSTGILASRAVHERRREIGTLRALGFEESQVRWAFLVESTLTTLVGLLIGLAVGLVVAASVWWRTDARAATAFSPPWLTIALFGGALLALSALAALGPAIRASRLPPAVAVRHVE